jgi:hypothetical protein
VGPPRDAARRRRPNELDARARQARIEARADACCLVLELKRQRVAQRLQRPEAVTGRRLRPEPGQETGDDDVLLGLGAERQRRPRQAALDEQRDRLAELLGGM